MLTGVGKDAGTLELSCAAGRRVDGGRRWRTVCLLPPHGAGGPAGPPRCRPQRDEDASTRTLSTRVMATKGQSQLECLLATEKQNAVCPCHTLLSAVQGWSAGHAEAGWVALRSRVPGGGSQTQRTTCRVILSCGVASTGRAPGQRGGQLLGSVSGLLHGVMELCWKQTVLVLARLCARDPWAVRFRGWAYGCELNSHRALRHTHIHQ